MTAKELAAQLGVSPSAVSIALNEQPGISEKTRTMILKAAEAYGIENLRRKPKFPPYINLVIYKKHGFVVSDSPFFLILTESISAQVVENGYQMQITYFYGNQNIDEQIKSLSTLNCLGIILLATEMGEEDIIPFHQIKKPIVVLDNYFEGEGIDCIAINNSEGVHCAVKHFLERGHSSFGYIHSKVSIRNFVERSESFKLAVSKAGSVLTDDIVHIYVSLSQDGAYQDMCEYLRKGGKVPPALFADNDVIAISCMRALLEFGYRIPEDVSVIGFDDLPMSCVTIPKLSTVRVAKDLFGRKSASILFERINEEERESHVCIRIGAALVERETVSEIVEN